MRRFCTAGFLVVLIVASALAGYEVGVHQPVWSSSTSQIAKTGSKSEQPASDDVTFSVIFDRTVRQAAEKIDGLAAKLDARSLTMESVFARLSQFAVGAINFANV